MTVERNLNTLYIDALVSYSLMEAWLSWDMVDKMIIKLVDLHSQVKVIQLLKN